MTERFLSFDEAKRQLGISDSELKQMVSNGEIQNDHDEWEMRFRPSEIERIKKKRSPTIPFKARYRDRELTPAERHQKLKELVEREERAEQLKRKCFWLALIGFIILVIVACL